MWGGWNCQLVESTAWGIRFIVGAWNVKLFSFQHFFNISLKIKVFSHCLRHIGQAVVDFKCSNVLPPAMVLGMCRVASQAHFSGASKIIHPEISRKNEWTNSFKVKRKKLVPLCRHLSGIPISQGKLLWIPAVPINSEFHHEIPANYFTLSKCETLRLLYVISFMQ